MRNNNKFEDNEIFDVNKVDFKPVSVYHKTFLQNFFLYQHYYSEKRKSLGEFLEWQENFSNKMIKNLTNLKSRTITQDEITSIKELNTILFPRISDKLFSSLKNRMYFLFLYSEVENYFFKCMKYLMISKSFPDNVAEKNTTDVIMKNSWYEILKMFKELYKIRHNINDDLIQELNNFRTIRNLFAHGNGIITNRFLKRFQNPDFHVGEIFDLNTDIIPKYTNTIIGIIPQFDEVLLKKCPELVDI